MKRRLLGWRLAKAQILSIEQYGLRYVCLIGLEWLEHAIQSLLGNVCGRPPRRPAQSHHYDPHRLVRRAGLCPLAAGPEPPPNSGNTDDGASGFAFEAMTTEHFLPSRMLSISISPLVSRFHQEKWDTVGVDVRRPRPYEKSHCSPSRKSP